MSLSKLVFGTVLALGFSSAFAQTAPAGDKRPQDVRVLAANCANCHGTNGNNSGNFFRLAGLKQDYFIAQMKAFKEGKREATIMHQLAKGYSDEQIALMAAYFARQKAN